MVFIQKLPIRSKMLYTHLGVILARFMPVEVHCNNGVLGKETLQVKPVLRRVYIYDEETCDNPSTRP